MKGNCCLLVLPFFLPSCSDPSFSNKDLENNNVKIQREEQGPLSEEVLREFQACKTDSDCVYANNGCCDCANGGEETAINKAKVDNFKEALSCLQ